MKVFIVTSGSYSDYEISAVFTTEKLANEYIATNHGDFNAPDEYECDVFDNAHPITLVHMAKNGDVLEVEHKKGADNSADWITYPYGNNSIWWPVRTIDEKTAIKAVNENRIQILAMGIWGDGLRTYELFEMNRWGITDPKKEI